MDGLIAWLGGETDVLRTVVVGVLVAARVLPLTLFAPWIALQSTPPLVRAGLVLALTAALTPLAVQYAPEVPLALPVLAALALREALVGAVFAVAAALPLHALDWAGRLIDTWRGASLAEVISPAGERTSPLGQLYLLFGIVLFVSLGGHRLALGAFASGLADVPVGAVDVVGGIGAVALGAARLAGHALAFAVALAAPAAVAIVLVEVALGLAARAAPEMPAFFAGMPLRAAVGIGAALAGLSILVGELPDAFRQAVEAALGLVDGFG